MPIEGQEGSGLCVIAPTQMEAPQRPKTKATACFRLFSRTLVLMGLLRGALMASAQDFSKHDAKLEAWLAKMTLDEKIGQMVQVDMAALQDKADIQKYFLGSVLSRSEEHTSELQSLRHL